MSEEWKFAKRETDIPEYSGKAPKKKWKDCPVCAGLDLGCTYGLTDEERNAEKDSWK